MTTLHELGKAFSQAASEAMPSDETTRRALPEQELIFRLAWPEGFTPDAMRHIAERAEALNMRYDLLDVSEPENGVITITVRDRETI